MYADDPADCAVPVANCACGGAGQAACSTQGERNKHGFRIEAQVARFLWDMIDIGKDVGNVDDVNLTINSFVSTLESMPCTFGTNTDGSCNEPYASPCKMDAYNVYDYAEIFPTNESQERTLNCVAGAVD